MTGAPSQIFSDRQSPPNARFLGARRTYWRLLTRGAVLLMTTLGIYRFWLTTDVRTFLLSNTEVDGEALEYNGTALELLLGFLVAIATLISIYAVFFLAAFDLGIVGQLSGAAFVVALFVLGQYAIYRARRYRLTRTVYRGLRFHQEGSAWTYAARAITWWFFTILTLGLTYPFQLASLERYKMRNTYYGDLPGHFDATGWRLFLRGLPIWLLVVTPLVLAVGVFLEATDLEALAVALSADTDDVLARIELGNPGFANVIAFAMLMGAAAVASALLLYPAFQSVLLRWWLNGLRFGPVALRSALRMRRVYGAWLRFVLYGLLFSLGLVALGFAALVVLGYLVGPDQTTASDEVAAILMLLAGYVIAALGFSTIYRATVRLALWQLGVESLQLSGLPALDNVKAAGRPASPFGEGLADALNVGGPQ